MKKLLRQIFTNIADRVSSKPNEKLIHQSLTGLYDAILNQHTVHAHLLETRSGSLIQFNPEKDKFIIFSDQHKGAGNITDYFKGNRKNYNDALNYYLENGYTLINLGDCEELWENKPEAVLKNYGEEMQLEAEFYKRRRYHKIFGNHDLLWFDKLAVKGLLEPFFDHHMRVEEGLVMQAEINGKQVNFFLTHGHQGDMLSDNNAFSKWFVGRIWVPIQRWLKININTPAQNYHLTNHHNRLMYLWTTKHPNTILITGHTHKPVFESLNHIQRLNRAWRKALNKGNRVWADMLRNEMEKRMNMQDGANQEPTTELMRPSYYNTGCCCFADGDITGIEIADGEIRLVKWSKKTPEGQPFIAEKADLEKIAAKLW